MPPRTPALNLLRRVAGPLVRQARFLARRSVIWWNGRLAGPIVVYQPGKVGSQSVYQSLSGLRLPHPVHHAHFLTGFDDLERMMRTALADPVRSLGKLALDREVQRALQERPNAPWNVVTLVRDPVARNISTFFQTLDAFYPEVQVQYSAGTHSMEVLHRRFLDIGFNKVSPDQWFEEQLRPVTGIDVFAVPFPWRQGYVVIRQGRVRLLLIRLESLEACAAQAFWEAFGIPRFRVPRYNTAEERWHRDLYRRFIDTLVLPEPFLRLMYDSRTARHFYSPQEIASFQSRWTRTGEVDRVEAPLLGVPREDLDDTH